MKTLHCQKCGGRVSEWNLLYYGFQKEVVCKNCGAVHTAKKRFLLIDSVISLVLSLFIALFLLQITGNAGIFFLFFMLIWVGLYVLANALILRLTNDIYRVKKAEKV